MTRKSRSERRRDSSEIYRGIKMGIEYLQFNIDDLRKSLRSAVLIIIAVLKLKEFLKYSIFNRKFSIILRRNT